MPLLQQGNPELCCHFDHTIGRSQDSIALLSIMSDLLRSIFSLKNFKSTRENVSAL